MTTDIREVLREIRERAERHDMPDPCAPGDECECCTTARDNKRLVEALEAVLLVHQPDEDTDCNADGDPYPCPTVRAITEALTTKEAL